MIINEIQLDCYIKKIIINKVPELERLFNKNISIGKVKFNNKPYEIYLDNGEFVFVYYDWRKEIINTYNDLFDLCYHLFELLISLYCENKYDSANKKLISEVREKLFTNLGNEYLKKFKEQQDNQLKR